MGGGVEVVNGVDISGGHFILVIVGLKFVLGDI